jgi:23S rRNA pseudouridine2605 synthase
VSPRVLELTITEGRNRQVRRMVETVGNEVVKLARIRFGPIDLGELPEGKARRLRPHEVKRLWKDAGADER